MDRKNFCKTTCGLGISSCLGFGFLSNTGLSATGELIQEADKRNPIVPVDLRQIQNVLRFVDSSMDEPSKKAVFERLGMEHTTSEKFIVVMDGYKKDLKGYFDSVNSKKDTYWEKMEYNPDTSVIKITGKVVDRCACSYAQCANPPKSLCNYCCKNFQKQMFEIILGKKVEVKIDAAFLLGDNRCSTTIFVDGKLPLERI
jgi:hypothetical protein